MTTRNKVILFACVLSSLLAFLPAFTASISAQSQVEMPFSTAGFQTGTIEDLHGTTIRIDGRMYVIKADAIVVNHKGQPLELERIIPSSVATFHLKEGHIDKMVVKLPQ